MATKPKGKRNNRLLWILLAAAGVLIAVAVIQGRNKKVGEKVYVEKVGKRTILETVAASGRIYPEKEVKISSDVSGEVVELKVKEGDSIKAGQLLARVNPEIYKNQLERGEASLNASKAQLSNAQAQIKTLESQKVQAQAQRDQIQAQLANAKTSFDRNNKLHDQGVISDADFETAQATFRQTEANLRSSDAAIQTSIANVEASLDNVKTAEFNVKGSEASFKESRTNLNKTSIYAPVDGIVSKLTIQKGERVVGTAQMSGTEMMRVANMNAMEVQVDVSENDILRISVGNEVDIDVDAYPGKKFKGRISEIANTAENAFTTTGNVNLTTDQVTNFVVKVRIDPATYADINKTGRSAFRPGLSASVNIHTNTVNDALSVPVQAVTTREEKEPSKVAKAAATTEGEQPKKANSPIQEVVFVCVGDTVKKVTVKTGIQDNDYIQILSGLTGGEEVVAEPYNSVARKLKSGMKITRVSKTELYKVGDKKE